MLSSTKFTYSIPNIYLANALNIFSSIKTAIPSSSFEPITTSAFSFTASSAFPISIPKPHSPELSETLHDTRQEQALSLELTPLPRAQKQPEPQIPPKPKMSAGVAAYPRLHKIYKELVRQNETIFAAEKERNALEDKQSSLKGVSKPIKKGELQSEIDRINERIDLLKVGLSGIAKRYGYQTVQDFYRAYHTGKNAYADYQEKASKWEETYGKNIQKPKKESGHEQLQRFQKEKTVSQVQHSAKVRIESRDKSPF